MHGHKAIVSFLFPVSTVDRGAPSRAANGTGNALYAYIFICSGSSASFMGGVLPVYLITYSQALFYLQNVGRP